MTQNPRISIVVPNFNSGDVLERALQSILAQTYTNYELIVCDSKSTDNSAQVIELYRDRIHVLIEEKDKGQADGLNRGFARATGDVFCWLCADDELFADAFETVVRIFERNPEADVVIGGCERVFADGERQVTAPPPNALELAAHIDLIEQPSCFWRAGLHKRCGPLNDTFHLVFDWEFWCRMHREGARAVTTEHVLSRYYFSETNKTSTSGMRFVEEASRVLSEYGPMRGKIASVYRMLFHHFDMHGCYDRPVSCGRSRWLAFMTVHRLLRIVIGQQLTDSYNWQFAARQARGLKWW